MRRRAAALVTTAAVALAVALALGTGDEPVPAGPVLLPDLWSSAPFELQLDTVEGRTVLRFTSEINNQGRGDFIVRGSTRTGGFDQHLVHEGGGTTSEPVDVAIVWGGDTHFHWHIEDVARYWIESENRALASPAADNKVGFCFFDGVDRDSDLAGAPTEPVHPADGCGSRLEPAIDMGLSVGWGDQYRYDLEGQYIDIEALPSGEYVLLAEVDPDRRFIESDISNNRAETRFTLIVSESGRRTLLG